MTGEANDGTPDSGAELWFRTGDPSYQIYVLMDGENIAASASMWRITDERAAIENIVTAVGYRRKGYAKAIITYVLKMIKEQGYSMATLSMRGRNKKASRLYQGLSFELLFNQIELIYPFD